VSTGCPGDGEDGVFRDDIGDSGTAAARRHGESTWYAIPESF